MLKDRAQIARRLSGDMQEMRLQPAIAVGQTGLLKACFWLVQRDKLSITHTRCTADTIGRALPHPLPL